MFGGRSHEHQISCLSARTVVDAARAAGHTPVTVGVDRQGRFVRCDVPVAEPGLLPEVGDGPTATLVRTREQVDVVTFNDDGTVTTAEPVDVAFAVMHGAGGEDGTIQGLFDTLGLPYVGANVAASALGVDKIAMKQQFAAAGLPQVPFVAVTRPAFTASPQTVVDEIARRLHAPWFVKPACEGSSFGISRIDDKNALDDAIRHAFTFGARVIVEEGVVGARELEVGVIGDADPEITVPGEIVSAHTFYDFDAKYTVSSTLNIPADVPESLVEQIKRLATVAYQAIGCTGLARVDFFLTGEKLLVNEINTIPGFTAHSMFPMLWAHEGMPFPQLVDRLISDALHAAKPNG